MAETIIAALQAITVAGLGVVGIWIKVLGTRQKKTHYEITNDHKTNLRDDMDANHAEVMRAVNANTLHVARLDAKLDTHSHAIKTLEERMLDDD